MPIEFRNDVQKECYGKLKGYLGQLFGELAEEADDSPAFFFSMGSAMVRIYALGFGKSATFAANSWVVRDVETTLPLAKFLLEANANMTFGAFGIDEDGDVFFRQSIFAPTATKEDVRHLVMSVLSTADEWDDEIQKKFGGRRSADPAEAPQP